MGLKALLVSITLAFVFLFTLPLFNYSPGFADITTCYLTKIGPNAPKDVNYPVGCTAPASASGKIPLYKQWDTRWGNDSYGCGETLASAACGPTSMAMIISYYKGTSVFPPEVAKKVMANGMYQCGVGTSWSALTAIPQTYGLKSKSITWTEAKRYLSQNIPVIVSQGPGYFTTGGHFIVVTGADPSGGGYLINDPDMYHRTQATEGQITEGFKNSWVITN